MMFNYTTTPLYDPQHFYSTVVKYWNAQSRIHNLVPSYTEQAGLSSLNAASLHGTDYHVKGTNHIIKRTSAIMSDCNAKKADKAFKQARFLNVKHYFIRLTCIGLPGKVSDWRKKAERTIRRSIGIRGVKIGYHIHYQTFDSKASYHPHFHIELSSIIVAKGVIRNLSTIMGVKEFGRKIEKEWGSGSHVSVCKSKEKCFLYSMDCIDDLFEIENGEVVSKEDGSKFDREKLMQRLPGLIGKGKWAKKWVGVGYYSNKGKQNQIDWEFVDSMIEKFSKNSKKGKTMKPDNVVPQAFVKTFQEIFVINYKAITGRDYSGTFNVKNLSEKSMVLEKKFKETGASFEDYIEFAVRQNSENFCVIFATMFSDHMMYCYFNGRK